MQKNKTTYKDNLFRYLFSDRENFIKMYEDTTGKKLDSDFIDCYDTSMIMVEDFKNDVSFLTKDDSLIIMVEQSSPLDVNLSYRLLNYYMAICNKLLREDSSRGSIHQRRGVKLPTPESYVLYNGDETIDYTELPSSLDSTDVLSFKATICDIHFDNLVEKIEDKEDVLLGYAYVIDGIENRQNEGMTLEDAVTETLKSCKTEGYLLKYLEKEEDLLRSMILEEFPERREEELEVIEEQDNGVSMDM